MSRESRAQGSARPLGNAVIGAVQANRQPKTKTLSRNAGEGQSFRRPEAWRPRLSGLVHQAVEFGGVLAGDLVDHIRRQAGELLVDVFGRFGPDAVGMRIVRAPHDGFDADV